MSDFMKGSASEASSHRHRFQGLCNDQGSEKSDLDLG